MLISDWRSDVCSSDLLAGLAARRAARLLDGAGSERGGGGEAPARPRARASGGRADRAGEPDREPAVPARYCRLQAAPEEGDGAAGGAARLRRGPAAGAEDRKSGLWGKRGAVRVELG